MLLGFAGSLHWATFAASAEAGDGEPHPLDRWSRRIIGALAAACGAHAHFPDGASALPFQRLARRAHPVHPSPLGLLIDAEYGLWHAYRGALWLPVRLTLPAVAGEPSPCADCTARPCLDGCPVGAFTGEGFLVERCRAHLASAAGAACRSGGCLARLACPVGAGHRYGSAQMRFHLEAFRRAAD